MSEDVGVKAPVTRLRRRLSVETEDAKSPAGTTTPTKKKGGRLATKPQLDLIIENDAEQVPKRSTRKAGAKDIVELVDDKPMTPSRRSARIRSNTSIVSETTQSILDSPRAKRAAARRTSQAGSDNDGPVTPARQTRRTRKDSTSSIDKQGEKANNKSSATPEIIAEEQESNNDVSSVKDNSISKSPTGRGKKGKKNSLSQPVNETENDIKIADNKTLNTFNNKDKREIDENSSESVVTMTSTDNSKNNEIVLKDKKSDNVESNDVIAEYLDEKPKKRNSVLHKSTSAIEDSKSFKSKRHRTKSGSTLTRLDADSSNECNFFSDNEIYKKKKKDKSFSLANSDLSLTKLRNMDKENETQNTSKFEVKVEIVHNLESQFGSSSDNKEVDDKSMTINDPANNSLTKAGWKKNIINQIENMIDSSVKTDTISHMDCFNKEPSKDIQPVIIMEEDSDSNAGNNGSVHPTAQLDNEDQCVPVVKHSVHNSNEEMSNDNSCEPMDIDESIHHTSIIQSVKSSPRAINQQLETQNQFSVSIEQSNEYSKVTSNKSKRKSSLSSSEFHNLEKSTSENKSTLILSQIKDTSASEVNGKSPKVDNKDQLSKSVNIPDKLKNKESERKKLSLDYSTSTPLQQKSMKKLGVPMDTSLISPKTKNKTNSTKRDESIEKSTSHNEDDISKENSDMESDDNLDESDDSGEEITKTQNEFIDDEAEEANEDYQSGDSQDEEEKQYEEENEIVEKGETLDTDEEFSDDTDYEKDSFVVTSDEEDNELLSGSGDDLSLSDNELSMSAKSKKKYNERKIREQKKASKEMYEARHKLDNSKDIKKTKNKKNNRQRLDSSSSESDKEMVVQSKKTNRQRIDSSQELSDVKSNENESVMKKNKRNRLSESVCSESALNEQEITICNESKMETEDPIVVAIKHEPKTPQKNNLSAVVINDDIEEVNMDPNVTTMQANETSDPLQATMLEIDEDSESSDDNQEILKNYNSVLEGLTTNSKASKKHDISLNMNKKQKKAKEPIVDQLNLTQTKSKKTKNKTIEIDTMASQKQSEETNKINEPSVDQDGEESDSINMRLLFTEDSNDSVSNTDKIKSDAVGGATDVKDYIPLKKTEAKTNLLENMDVSTEIDTLANFNESKKKNKIRTSSQHIQVEDSSLPEGDDNEVSFFIDTTGIRFDVDKPADTSKSSSKKKKNRNSSCQTSIVEAEELPVVDDEVIVEKTPKKSLNNTENNVTEVVTPVTANTPQIAKKKKKGKKSLTVIEDENETQINEIDDTENIEDSFFIDTVGTRLDPDEPKNNSSKKKKKRNSTSDNNQEEAKELRLEYDEIITKKTPKKSLNTTGHQTDIEINTADEAADVSTNTLGSTKKNKKNKKSLTVVADENKSDNNETEQDEPTVPVKTPQSGKKKNKSLILNESMNKSTTQIQEELAVKTPQSGKKKNKSVLLDQSMNMSAIEEQVEFAVAITTPQSGKKKNKSLLKDQSMNKSAIEEQVVLAVPFTTPQSGKKKNKSLLMDQSMNKSAIGEEKEQESVVITSSSGKKKTKGKKSLNANQNESILIDDNTDVPIEVVQKSDKKRKSSQSINEPQVVIPLEYNKSDDEGDAPLEISYRSDKQEKNKLDTQQSDHVTTETSLNTSSNSAKKKKLKSILNLSESSKVTEDYNEVNIKESGEESSSKKRKRKHSATIQENISLDNEEKHVSEKLNESTAGSQKKKRKLDDTTEEISTLCIGSTKQDTQEISSVEALGHKKIKKNKHDVKQQNVQIIENETAKTQNKKRKEREDDIATNVAKILKHDSMNKAQVTRLPSHILNQLGDKPNKSIPGARKTKVIATTEFKVEETKVKKSKPSSYLEESVYLNEDTIVEKNNKKYSIKKPKVLPFIPTASTSDSGFTTSFRINVLPRETKFVAQATNVVNFKNDFLQEQKIKKFRTFEKYKNQRNVKLSKF